MSRTTSGPGARAGARATGPETQLALVDVPSALTERQQLAFDDVLAAGHQGTTPAEIGAGIHARWGKHPADKRCGYCVSDGYRMLCELRRKGRVKESRKLGGWRAVGADTPLPAGMTNEIPY